VYNKLTNTTVPLINWDAYLHDDLKLTGTTTTDFGTISSQTQITITNASHALAAGLSGTIQTNSGSAQYTWGLPAASAVTIAHALNQPTRPVIFGYTAGSLMVGMTAPAKRVGFFFGDTTATNMTTQGGLLFDAAVRWAADIPMPSTPVPAVNMVWATKANNPLTRMEANGIAVNGKLYVFGGYITWPNATNRADAYDPVTNTWTQLASMPDAITHTQVVSDGSKIYLVGGFVGPYPSTSTGKLWIYNIASNTWSLGPTLPLALGSGGAALHNGKLYFFGGALRTSTNYLDQWDYYVLDLNGGTAWQRLGNVPTKRNHLCAVVMDNKIYLIGGQVAHGEGNANLALVEMYDPATNTWSTRASMPIAKGHIATASYNGYIYVIGGAIDDGAYGTHTADISRYHPATNTWATVSPLPESRKQPVAGFINGKLYVTSGDTFVGLGLGGRQTNTTWEGTFYP
jgi:N-acetylneuraminic acid mutarotase